MLNRVFGELGVSPFLLLPSLFDLSRENQDFGLMLPARPRLSITNSNNKADDRLSMASTTSAVSEAGGLVA
jgi:hypothetical protein